MIFVFFFHLFVYSKSQEFHLTNYEQNSSNFLIKQAITEVFLSLGFMQAKNFKKNLQALTAQEWKPFLWALQEASDLNSYFVSWTQISEKF